jgi:uncharacterized protein YbaA (DUF1428 family)
MQMAYVDGFVVPVPKDSLGQYQEISRAMGKIYRELGALSYVECVADDVSYGELTSFPRAVQLTPEEVVVFAWITYESREQRDAINKKIMEDPRVEQECSQLPVDGKRMILGGFKTIVEM